MIKRLVRDRTLALAATPTPAAGPGLKSPPAVPALLSIAAFMASRLVTL
jgi:hypothetical protein